MLRHAFLMMVHKEPELFGRIVHVLAGVNHHFFVHIDKKVSDIEPYREAVKDVPNVTFTDRISVYHGGVSQIYCELLLYGAAYSAAHRMDYFHLISGQDYPLRSNEQFDDFFEHHAGMSFAAIEGQEYHDECMKLKYPLRTDVYHPNGRNLFERAFRKLTPKIQLRLHVRRCMSDIWGGVELAFHPSLCCEISFGVC